MHLLVLSAFRRQYSLMNAYISSVSMHLLVLSAFRPDFTVEVDLSGPCLNAPFGAQCFPTAWYMDAVKHFTGSQCTFWCSVLSDAKVGTKDAVRITKVSMHLLVLSAFRPSSDGCS